VGAVGRIRSAVQRVLDWWQDTRPGRAISWYGARNGALLCGGIAYSALFSLFAGLTIGFTVFVTFLGSRTELRNAVLEQIDQWIPGLIDTGKGGLLKPDDLVLPSAVNIASIVATVVLVFSAMGFMGALRVSVRAMFAASPTDDNALLARLWQLAGFVLLGLGVLVAAAASVASSAVGRVVESWLGGSPVVGVLLRIGAAAVGVVIDTLLVLAVVRVVGGVRPRRTRDLVLGCLAVGVVSGALRWVGTSVIVGSANRNALLASFAVLVTVLVLVNFVARVVLMACAWMHDPPRVDELVRAEQELYARRRAVEIDRIAREGQGTGRPWSPVVRGFRRATLN